MFDVITSQITKALFGLQCIRSKSAASIEITSNQYPVLKINFSDSTYTTRGAIYILKSDVAIEHILAVFLSISSTLPHEII